MPTAEQIAASLYHALAAADHAGSCRARLTWRGRDGHSQSCTCGRQAALNAYGEWRRDRRPNPVAHPGRSPGPWSVTTHHLSG